MDNLLNFFFFEWLAKVNLVTVACFLPGRAKDLSAPRIYWPKTWLFSAVHEEQPKRGTE